MLHKRLDANTPQRQSLYENLAFTSETTIEWT